MKAITSIIGILLAFLPLSAQNLNYSIRDLGTLANDESFATSINNQNVIAGLTKETGIFKDFIWEHGKGLMVFPRPSSYEGQTSYQFPLINNNNQIANIFWCKTNYWFKKNLFKHICIYDNKGVHQDLQSPNLWQLQELEDWQKPSTWENKDLAILAFNDDQQILIANSNEVNKATKFAIWQNGTYNDLDSKLIRNAYKMNNQGVILGRKWKQTESGAVPMLVLYHPSEGTCIDIVKDINILQCQINDHSQVIIFQGNEERSIIKGFLWDPKKGLIELEDFAPMAFNNCDQIIGFKISEIQKNKKFEPLLWTPDRIIPLSQFIGLDNIDSLWSKVTNLNGINDNGYIIGQALFDGKKHAFVLIPQ